MGLDERGNPSLPPEPELPPRMWGIGEVERRQIERAAREGSLKVVAIELESRANHIGEAIKWVKADNPRVADYLGAVKHGLRLGALAARARL